MMRLPRFYQIVAAWFSWLVFGGVSLALNLVCALLLVLPGRRRRGGAARAAIRWLFGGWCSWLHATRLVYVNWSGFTPENLRGPAVYIANHPGLLDATFILARLPDTICIFKPAVMRNPALGPAAILAGYASGDAGLDVIRDVAERLAAGRSLLIFPEGTRTKAATHLNPLRPGFAVIATRARVPVRLLLVRAPRDLLPKGQAWWQAPRLPARVDVEFLGEIATDGDTCARELTALATEWFSAALAAS